MSRNIVVKESSIEGKGVFATRDFKKGDIVFIFKGKVYHNVINGPADTAFKPNSIGFGKNLWIDPIDKFPFINHSCEPNMGIKGRVTFVALRNIRKGDELTFDYSIIEEDKGWKMKNLEKKGPHFRPVIQSIQYLPEKVYKSYLPYIPKYFQSVYTSYHKNLKAHGQKV